MIGKLLHRFRNNEQGTTMIEFAFVAMLLFTLLFGIIEFGWIFNGYITLTSAAQEGARMAIVGEDDQDIREAIYSHARIFDEDNLQIGIFPGATHNDDAEVTLDGELDLLISFPPFPQSISLSTSATMKQE